MFRNQYDTDVTTWSPQGRLFQIEYAMEAVKQGACSVGLKSSTHAVLVALRRVDNTLATHQPKVFKLDDHIGMASSGIAADGRMLCKYMRNECLNHRYVFESPLVIGRLVRQVADRAQAATQRSWKRPLGVGLLVAGQDASGVKLYSTCPSGNYYEHKAAAIGARSQAARTYLERNLEAMESSSMDELIQHGLKSLQASVGEDKLKAASVSIAVVGKDTPFFILDDAAVEAYLGAQEAAEEMEQ
eukprot:CAMPEP_0175073088 /NCGR_PEP_ID=MMETSP0052_2-20121109/20329_1 /TAXON_ID=51329 ORGANISM="Polytomella parva, Strain SAG 63-3" /NCGR_SAMPLE_ID=MMETSP0052_2 /ASSEMBLY_ACC=CAM_ASM_000194 /LENGTH=243 /DNA_ID=CAMNT_0016340781 /DNA_START=26 /DNA_END=757 /DNA_ORIENTATION=-